MSNLHIDDSTFFDEIVARSFQVARLFSLPLVTVEPKRRPHPGGALGVCYTAEGRIAIVVRTREGKVWSARPIKRGVVWETVAHELAHLRERGHGKAHRTLTEQIHATLILRTICDDKYCDVHSA